MLTGAYGVVVLTVEIADPCGCFAGEDGNGGREEVGGANS